MCSDCKKCGYMDILKVKLLFPNIFQTNKLVHFIKRNVLKSNFDKNPTNNHSTSL